MAQSKLKEEHTRKDWFVFEDPLLLSPLKLTFPHSSSEGDFDATTPGPVPVNLIKKKKIILTCLLPPATRLKEKELRNKA